MSLHTSTFILGEFLAFIREELEEESVFCPIAEVQTSNAKRTKRAVLNMVYFEVVMRMRVMYDAASRINAKIGPPSLSAESPI